MKLFNRLKLMQKHIIELTKRLVVVENKLKRRSFARKKIKQPVVVKEDPLMIVFD